VAIRHHPTVSRPLLTDPTSLSRVRALFLPPPISGGVDQNGGPPSLVSQASKGRKRGKKARRAWGAETGNTGVRLVAGGGVCVGAHKTLAVCGFREATVSLR